MDERVERVLARLEELEGRTSGFWNVPCTTGLFLNKLIRSGDMRTVLEIGTSNGYSGIWIAEALSHTGGRLYTVESHAERFQMASENFLEAGVAPWIVQVKGHAPEIFEDFREGPFDLIFVDATKLEYASYLEAVLPMLASGGLIVCDNALTHAGELEGFFEMIEKRSDLEGSLLSMDNGLYLIVRR